MPKQIPLPAVIVVIGIIVLALIISLRPQANTSISATSVYQAGYNLEAQVTINGQDIQLSNATQTNPLSWKSANQLRPSDIYAINRKNNQVTLILKDGSHKKLTNFDIDQLPEQIKLKVTYEATN